MKKVIPFIAILTVLVTAVRAEVPEPDNIIYGMISLGQTPVTASQTNVIISASATASGPSIATYQMGSRPNAGDFYTLRITLESLLPVVNPAAALSNQLVYITVNDGTGVRAQASAVVGGRGQITRMDLAAANAGQSTMPSDNNPTDNVITVGETVAYLLAWRTGAPWAVAPTNIPLSYAVRTGALWRGGGAYQLNSTVSSAPAWWVDVGSTNSMENSNLDTAISSLPAAFVPGQPVTVSIAATPGSVLSAYGVEDQPPEGWTVANINNGGVYDAVNGKVKWGLFFDSTARTLSYQATPPLTANGTATFTGSASYDGVVTMNISGQRTTTFASTPTFSLTKVGQSRNFHIGLKGTAGQIFTIRDSTNLTSWQVLSNVTLGVSGTFDFYDPVGTNGVRFYQVLQGE